MFKFFQKCFYNLVCVMLSESIDIRKMTTAELSTLNCGCVGAGANFCPHNLRTAQREHFIPRLAKSSIPMLHTNSQIRPGKKKLSIITYWNEATYVLPVSLFWPNDCIRHIFY